MVCGSARDADHTDPGEPHAVNEATIIKTLDLPHGADWALYADANLIVLSPRLDACGRDRALDEVCAHWRETTAPNVVAAFSGLVVL